MYYMDIQIYESTDGQTDVWADILKVLQILLENLQIVQGMNQYSIYTYKAPGRT